MEGLVISFDTILNLLLGGAFGFVCGLTAALFVALYIQKELAELKDELRKTASNIDNKSKTSLTNFKNAINDAERRLSAYLPGSRGEDGGLEGIVKGALGNAITSIVEGQMNKQVTKMVGGGGADPADLEKLGQEVLDKIEAEKKKKR